MRFSSMVMGQYVPTDSIVHRLDPRAKLLGLLCLVSGAFAAGDASAVALSTLTFAALLRLSRLSLAAVLRSARPVFFLVAFTFAFSAASIWLGEGDILLGLRTGGFSAFRLLILMLFAVLLPLTTAPLEMADGLEELLSPLARLGFPAGECAMMVGMALRFIPLLMEETDRIMRAQISRGARLDQGGVLRRIVAFFPVLIPLFVIVFRRADDIALAMEARGYGGGAGRTRRRPLHWKKSDTGATILCACFAASLLLWRTFGG